MNKQLIAFLDKYGLTGSYSGGGDSGGIEEFTTTIPVEPGDPLDINMDSLQNWVYNNSLTEYGGWSGSWDASGEIGYDKETKQILVTGTEESEDDLITIVTFEICLADFFTGNDAERVSHVFIGMSHNEETSIRLHVENGPWTQSLDDTENAILRHMSGLARKYDEDNGYRYNLFQEFKLNEPVKLDIDKLDITDKSWSIDLNETEFVTNKIYEEA
jgi:hypothetical protein